MTTRFRSGLGRVRILFALCSLLAPVPAMAEGAPLSAPNIPILSADMGSLARIEMSWPDRFDVRARQNNRVLELDFDAAFNAPDLGAMRQRLGAWIAGIEKSATRLVLRATDDVRFHVFRSERVLTIEMTWDAVSGQTQEVAARADEPRITLRPPGSRPKVNLKRPTAPPPPPERATAPAEGAPGLDDRALEALKRLRRSFFEPAEARLTASWVVESAAGQAARAEVSASETDAGAQLAIAWPSPIVMTLETGPNELLLRFDQPIDGRIADGLAEKLPDWLVSVSAGYDSLFLIGQPGVDLAASHDAASTQVVLTRAGANAAAPSDADVRLEILRARLKARTGETGEAREKLDELQQANPENVDVVAEKASIEESVGGWRRAAELYKQALSLDPARRDLASAERALDREYGSQVRVDWDYQQVQDGDLQIPVVITGRFLPTDTLDAGFRLENRYLDDDQVQRVNGVQQAITTLRQRGEIYLGGWVAPSHRLEGAILGSQGGPGAELRYRHQTPDTVTSVTAAWNGAYWDLVEGLVDKGVRDGVSIRHEHQFDRRWSGTAGLSLNRLGADGISTAATSVQVNASVNYLVPWRGADLSIGYSFDAQYVGTLETRRDVNGNAFNPLPLTDTEFHAFNWFVSDVFLEDFRYNIFGSLGFDRFGGFGPSIGGELIWELADDIQMGLRAGHSRASGRGDASVFTRLGGFALIRF